jgi:hypothetical protein
MGAPEDFEGWVIRNQSVTVGRKEDFVRVAYGSRPGAGR